MMTLGEALLIGASVVGLGALALSAFVWWEARLDLRAVNRARLTNGRRYVATRAIVSETIRLIVLFHLSTAAILSVLNMRYEVDTGATALVLFLLAQVGLAADALHGLRTRRRLTEGHR